MSGNKQNNKTINMEKKIEDYLPFYLGCEFGIYDNVGIFYRYKLLGIKPYAKNIQVLLEPLEEDIEGYGISVMSWHWIDEGKLILQPLSCMIDAYFKPESFRIMIYKGIDLFGLIESGLAFDKTKITNNELLKQE